MSRRWTTEVSLLAVSLVGAVSVARLTSGTRAWPAALLAAVAGAGVAAAVGRRLSPSSSLVAGTAAVALTAIWVSVPGATRDGLPTLTTFRRLDHALRAVGAIHVPVAAGTGVVLMAALVAGVAAVVTRALPGTFGLVPAVAVLAASTVALPSEGAALLAVVLAATSVTVVLSRSPQRADLRAGWRVGTVTTVASALCVVLVGVVTGAGGASGGGIAVVGVPPTALSLVSRLTALEIHDPDLVLFTAATPVPTYWQIGSLSVLRDDTWVPDAATEAALDGRPLPVTGTGPSSGRTFTVTVTVANLSSRLLPVPPSTTGVSTATLTAIGVVTPTPSRPGLRYRATATVPQVPQAGTAGAATTGAAAPTPADTELPALPPVVSSLARSVTASASTPLGKAEALTNWFRSRLFHYSLRPTATTLVSFLTTSRSGSCEQFAGAFAVLARAVGLPTRVAIGFTTGVRDPAGQTVVRGIDAHAWPEVFLGGSWISFEPTPQSPSGELAPPGVVGTTAVGNPNPVAPTTIPPGVTGTTLPPPLPAATTTITSGATWVWALVTGVVLVAVAVAALVLWRRRRRRRAGDELARAWTRVDRALRRRSLGRPPWRTPVAHARFLRSTTEGGDLDAVLADLEWLADSVEEAAYGPTPADDDLGRRARVAGRRVARALSTTGGR